MARIRKDIALVELFIIGEVMTPLESNSDGLITKTPLLYALLRIGRICTDSHNEYVLGVRLDCHLEPTLCTYIEYLDKDPMCNFRRLARTLPSRLKREVLKNLPTAVIEDYPPDHDFRNLVYRRGAVLVPQSALRKMNCTVKDGIGIFVERRQITQILRRGRKEEARIKAEMDGSNGICTSKIPTWQISSRGLNVGFGVDCKMMDFLHRSLDTFADRLAKKRLAQRDKSSEIVYGSAAA